MCTNTLLYYGQLGWTEQLVFTVVAIVYTYDNKHKIAYQTFVVIQSYEDCDFCEHSEIVKSQFHTTGSLVNVFFK